MAIRSVIIGAGFMGRRHIDTIKNAEGYEFCGISDLRQDALDLAANAGASPETCFNDTVKMLDEIKPQFALISTTATSHFDLAKLAVEKGVKSLLVEKPFCVSIRQARELRNLCENNGVQLAVNHGMRFDRHYMNLLTLAKREDLGPLTSVTYVGGNVGIAMNISHQLELFRILTGSPLETVQAWLVEDATPNPRGAQFHDGAGRIMGTNANGQRFFADVSPDQWHGIQMILGFRYGQMHVDLLTRRVYINRRREDQLQNPSFRYSSPFEVEELRLETPYDTHVRMLEAMRKGEGYPGGEIGEDIVRILAAIWHSSENGGRQVSVHDQLPDDREFAWA